MDKNNFYKTINFLIGISWGIIIFGSIFIIKFFMIYGFKVSFIVTLFFIIFMLLVILLFDFFIVNREKLIESKKQTKLLEKIYKKHTN